MTTQMELFECSSPCYARAFALRVRGGDERTVIRAFLARQIRALAPPLTAEGWAIDWGAGTGALTRELVRHFRRVAAVEPLAEFRPQLHQAWVMS